MKFDLAYWIGQGQVSEPMDVRLLTKWEHMIATNEGLIEAHDDSKIYFMIKGVKNILFRIG